MTLWSLSFAPPTTPSVWDIWLEKLRRTNPGYHTMKLIEEKQQWLFMRYGAKRG